LPLPLAEPGATPFHALGAAACRVDPFQSAGPAGGIDPFLPACRIGACQSFGPAGGVEPLKPLDPTW
jgi:hypothetical protein